ncbi:unnamed protein product [Protopolystoma xenopodis]|uniref:BHLH domain-containing protein n=1 Tax=Protopolystoma xenopodis TaxID=117903 RepID=A0A448XHY3_9PLAT|nr:unnamed protein product [Protopolystoma xenopodis]
MKAVSRPDFDRKGIICRGAPTAVTVLSETAERRRNYPDFREEICNKNRRPTLDALQQKIPRIQPESEKRATILQMTAKYINSLMARVNLLEKEVAVYRQSVGSDHVVAAENDAPESGGFSRKRKNGDLCRSPFSAVQIKSNVTEKSSEPSRMRRRKAETSSVRYDPQEGVTSIHYVPIEQDSMPFQAVSGTLTARNYTIISPSSYVSESPRPESTSSTAARLEHLVMAIEQIEGGRTLNVSSDQESPEECSLSVDPSPTMPSDSLFHQGQENFTFTYATPQQVSILKPTSDVFPEIFAQSGDIIPTDLTDVCKRKLSESSSSGEYPIVAKLLNRPIPHKYLHRPQVVVNSTH